MPRSSSRRPAPAARPRPRRGARAGARAPVRRTAAGAVRTAARALAGALAGAALLPALLPLLPTGAGSAGGAAIGSGVGPGVARAQAPAPLLRTVGTGAVSGAYYPVGGAIAGAVNRVRERPVLTVEATRGSVDNLTGLRDGRFDLAIAQSDVARQAREGAGPFEGAPVSDLLAVASLHPEPMHLVCADAAGVEGVRDLAGLRVDLGAPGSGVASTAAALLAAVGMGGEGGPVAVRVGAPAAPGLLRAGRIDCFFYAVGVGGAAVREALAIVDAHLVPLDDPELVALAEADPAYGLVRLPAGVYPGQDEAVTLFGVRALLLARPSLPRDEARAISAVLVGHASEIAAAHPALAGLEPSDLARPSGIPFHPGAATAFREAGLR